MRQLQALAAFRRRSAHPSADVAAAPDPAGAASDASSGSGIDPETVDFLEGDVLKAIAGVREAIGSANGEVGGTREDLEHIRANMGELASAGRGAAAQTVALAASTEQLAATSGEITKAMDQASVTVSRAVSSAQDANALIATLATATEEIVGIVEAIASVARQTNLLALNATIEAARAGAAGRGFSVVANEVKALSVEAGNAANDIRVRIERLRDSAGSSITAVERVVSEIQDVQPVFGTVRAAVDEQGASIGELAERASEASNFVREVSARAERVDEAALDASRRIEQAGEAANRAEALAGGLGQRFIAVMRQSELGDRRKLDRYPTDLKVTLAAGGRSASTNSVDISRGGLLLAPVPGVAAGASVAAEVERIGRLDLRVVASSPMGLHCRFERLDETATARIEAAVAEVEAEYKPLIDAARAAASRVEQAFERAVTDGRLSREQLFDTAYRPVAGTNPVQFDTSYIGLAEEVLPPILEPLLISDNRMVFCIAVDRNGYIPVHNRKCSLPQRPGDVAWNTVNCRNKRIFDDRAGIAAARSTRPFLVQAYNRDMGGHMVMVREVDAPIRLFGKHWGGFRTAYRL